MAERSPIAAAVVMLLVLPGLFSIVTIDSRAAPGNPWFLRAVATERQTIYDIAVGDTDPSSPGDEIVLTGGGGIIDTYTVDNFQVKPIFQALKTQLHVAVGDVMSGFAGVEVVSVGQDYKVHVVHKEGNGAWVGQTVWTSVGSVNGVTIGEFNASHPGLEIAATGDKALVEIITEDKTQPTGWSVIVMPVQYVPITNMMCYSADVLSEYPGDELFVGSFSGDLYMAHRWPSNYTWNITSIWRDDYAVLEVHKGPSLVPGNTEPTIYAGSLFGRVTMLNYNGTNWTNTTIFEEKGRNPVYAVVPYDIDPRYAGTEILVGGIGANVHVLRYEAGEWKNEDIIDPSGQDRLKLLYDLDVGEFDSSHPGVEMVLGGAKQDLLLLEFVEPSFELVAMPAEQMTVSGHDAEFWVSLKAVGYFSGDVALTADTSVTFSKTIAQPGDLVMATVHTAASATDRTIKVNVTGHSLDLGMNRTVKLSVNALASTADGFTLEVSPMTQYTTPGFSTSFVVKPVSINNFDGPFEYYLNTTMPLTSSDIVKGSGDYNDPAIVTMTPTISTGTGAFPALITVYGFTGPTHRLFIATSVVTVVVDAGGGKDFSLISYPPELRGVPGSTLKYDILLSPLTDFPDQVLLTVDGLPAGSTSSLAARFVTIPSRVQFWLNIGDKTPVSYYVMTFHASGGGREHSFAVVVDVDNASTAGDFAMQVLPPILMARPGGTANFLVHTTGTLVPSLTMVPSGPFQGTISSGQDGNPTYFPMVVTVRTDASPGVYKGTVEGITEWQHNASFTLIVSTDLQEPDLSLDPADLLVSPGQDWPTFGLDAIVNRDLMVGKDLRYTAFGLQEEPPTYTVQTYNFSRELSLPTPQLGAGRYLVLFVFYLPNNPYGKTLFGTVTMTEPIAILTMQVKHDAWTPREGAPNGLEVTVFNNGLDASGKVTVEVLMDGKTIGTRTVQPIPSKRDSGPLDFQWTAASGDHNITVIMYVDNPGDGRVMSQPYEAGLQVYAWSLEGPALALALLAMLAAILAYNNHSKAEPGKARRPPRHKVEEEE